MFPMAWNSVTGECSGNVSRTGVEYHHVSSISVGSDANYIVASRELSTIWSLAHDGSGVQWTLSSELASSDYSFEHARDAFYQPHDVLQLPNGHLLVVDDGLNRRAAPSGHGQVLLRVVMYALEDAAADDAADAAAGRRARPRRRWRHGRGGDDGDDSGGGGDGERRRRHGAATTATTTAAADGATATKIARLVWQYEFPLQLARSSWSAVMATDIFNSCGGSVYPLANGNHLVAFTALDQAVTAHNESAGAHNVRVGDRVRRRAPDRGAGDDDDDDARSGPRVRASGTLLRFRPTRPQQNAAPRFVPWHKQTRGGGGGR